MKRAALTLAIATLTLTTGCGDDSTATPKAQDTPAAQEQATTGSPTPAESVPTAPPESAYAVLSKAKLEAALLTLQDVPVGYSQDPPSEPGTKTFCDYKPPFTEKLNVSRDFTKGGGMSSEFLSVGFRQFGSEAQSRASFDALTKALSTCKTDTYDGSTLEYALMSAPKVGEDSVGVRITSGGTTILQNFVLVGPTMINAGGGGLTKADADEVTNLVEAQVKTYQDAATK